jgi:MFS family permease
MAYNQKIRLYKTRNFSEKLNATIEFIRQNVKPLGKSIIYILGPLAILNGLLMTQYFNFMFENMNPENMQNMQNPFSLVFNPTYFGLIILSVIAGLMNFSIVTNFMRLYDSKYPEPITVTEVLNISWRDVFPLLGLMIIMGIILMLGFLLFIIPGIYLMVVLSLSIPALFFERKGIIESIGRSFRIIKGKWWSTFGIGFIAYLVAQAIAVLFVLPFYVFYFIGIFTMVEETGFSADTSAWWFQLGMTLSVMFMLLGGFVTQCIPIIAINFQFFNLVERQESVGLIGEIEKLES